MPEEDKKFFDVSKPHHVGPNPTSKPVIVGHHPTMPDPMIREDEAQSDGPLNISVRDEDLDEKHIPAHHLPEHHSTADPFVVHEPEPKSDSHPLPPTAKFPEPPEPPAGHHELNLPSGNDVYHKPRVWVWVAAALVALALVYSAIDAKTDVLPFHIFSHDKNNTAENSNQAAQNSKASSQTTLPTGFTRYQPTGTPLSFGYPNTWGTPATTADAGFTQRGKDKKSDGNHAYIITFATNKDVEVAITSSKYLPAARGTLYYDYLQWCVGTNDGKYYIKTLHFTTTAGIDTPSNAVCDQGPLSDAKQLIGDNDLVNKATIVQLNTKDANGVNLGDLYTASLANASDLVVLRVKDAKMTNSSDIKKLLSTITGAPTSQ